MVKARQLTWTNPAPPNGDSSYDHVLAKTPIGTYSIEWRSWKKYDTHTASLHSMMGNFCANGNDLDEAKELVQTHYQQVFEDMLDPKSLEGLGVWPNFIAPQQYQDAPVGWTDPVLPDFNALWASARACGYSIGLHGSMKRDCDLIAAPWTELAVSAEELVARLCYDLNLHQVNSIGPKPLGRVNVILNSPNTYSKPIDLSIMPMVRS